MVGILRALKRRGQNIQTLFDSLVDKHRGDLSDKKTEDTIVDMLI